MITQVALRAHHDDARWRLELQLRIGIPGEVFSGIGLAIKRRLKEQGAMVAGYANGCLSYIPTRAAFRAGGYATNLATHLENGAALAPSVGDVIAQNAVALASSLRRGGRAPRQERDETSNRQTEIGGN